LFGTVGQEVVTPVEGSGRLQCSWTTHRAHSTEGNGAMSRHVPRHERWSKLGPNEYRSGGALVRYAQGAWWAWLSYRQRQEPGPDDSLLPPWEDKCDRLGPFKRPRNAMIAAEQQAILLRRRHGENVAIETGDLRD